MEQNLENIELYLCTNYYKTFHFISLTSYTRNSLIKYLFSLKSSFKKLFYRRWYEKYANIMLDFIFEGYFQRLILTWHLVCISKLLQASCGAHLISMNIVVKLFSL